jgi:hypothetical protein
MMEVWRNDSPSLSRREGVKRYFRLPILSAVLAISACATPAQMHSEAQLNGVATRCGLAAGELIQNESQKRALVVVRQDVTPGQRRCVGEWARGEHLKTAFLNVQFLNDVSERNQMMALVAAASAVITLTRVAPDMFPAINMNGTVHRIVALTITGSPDLIPAVRQKLSKDGWKIIPSTGDNWTLVSPVGHSIDEVTALSFRVNNGEFGNLKFSVQLGPEDGKMDR